jgi:hypothetical protein
LSNCTCTLCELGIPCSRISEGSPNYGELIERITEDGLDPRILEALLCFSRSLTCQFVTEDEYTKITEDEFIKILEDFLFIFLCYESIKKINSDWSITDQTHKWLKNKDWQKGYDVVKSGNFDIDTSNNFSSLYAYISAGQESIGSNVYERISNFVQNTRDIETCTVHALRSIGKELGAGDIQFFDINYPNELRDIIDIFSVKSSKVLLEGSMLTNDSLETIENLIEIGPISNVMEGYDIDDPLWTDDQKSFVEQVSGNYTKVYDSEYLDYMECAISGILIKFLNLTEVEDYRTPPDEPEIEDEKIDLQVDRNFNVKLATDKFQSGEARFSDFTQSQQYLITSEIDRRRNESIKGNPFSKFIYEKQKKVREYVAFIENINNFGAIISKDSCNTIPEGGVCSFNSETSAALVDNTIRILRNICIGTSYQREYFRYLSQKHAIIGTKSIISEVLREYFGRNFSDQNDWRYKLLCGNQFGNIIPSNLSESITPLPLSALNTDIQVVEYFDTTEYMNISAVNDTVVNSVNSRYWEGEAYEDILTTSEHLPSEVSSFYFDKLGMNNKSYSEIQTFLNKVYEMGAVSATPETIRGTGFEWPTILFEPCELSGDQISSLITNYCNTPSLTGRISAVCNAVGTSGICEITDLLYDFCVPPLTGIYEPCVLSGDAISALVSGYCNIGAISSDISSVCNAYGVSSICEVTDLLAPFCDDPIVSPYLSAFCDIIELSGQSVLLPEPLSAFCEIMAASGDTIVLSSSVTDPLSAELRRYLGSENGEFPPANIKNQRHPSIAHIPILEALIEKTTNSFFVSLRNIILDNVENEIQTIADKINQFGVTINSWKRDNYDLTAYESAYEFSENTDFRGLQNPQIDRDGPWHPGALSAFIDNTSGFIQDFLSGQNSHYDHIEISDLDKTKIGNQLQLYENDIKSLCGQIIYEYAVDCFSNHYTLFKTEDEFDLSGKMWVRYKNHPLSFPMINGDFDLSQVDDTDIVTLEDVVNNVYDFRIYDSEFLAFGSGNSTSGFVSYAQISNDFNFSENRDRLKFSKDDVFAFEGISVKEDEKFVGFYNHEDNVIITKLKNINTNGNDSFLLSGSTGNDYTASFIFNSFNTDRGILRRTVNTNLKYDEYTIPLSSSEYHNQWKLAKGEDLLTIAYEHTLPVSGWDTWVDGVGLYDPTLDGCCSNILDNGIGTIDFEVTNRGIASTLYDNDYFIRYTELGYLPVNSFDMVAFSLEEGENQNFQYFGCEGTSGEIYLNDFDPFNVSNDLSGRLVIQAPSVYPIWDSLAITWDEANFRWGDKFIVNQIFTTPGESRTFYFISNDEALISEINVTYISGGCHQFNIELVGLLPRYLWEDSDRRIFESDDFEILEEWDVLYEDIFDFT